MNLEEALTKVEQIRSFKDLVNTSPIEIKKEEIDLGLESTLQKLVLAQKSFYREVDILNNFKSAQFPVAEEYGEDAQKWMTFEKVVYHSFKGMALGVLGLVVNNFVGEPLLSYLSSGTIVSSVVLASFCQFKTDTLFSPESHEFVEDVGKFYGSIKKYKSLFFENDLEHSSENYLDVLNSSLNDFRLRGKTNEELRILVSERNRVKEFYNLSPQITKAIIKSKKLPFPRWHPAVSLASITGSTSLTIERFKQDYQNAKDVDNLVKDFLKKPELIIYQ